MSRNLGPPLSTRQGKILMAIVEQHIATKAPVGSQQLKEEYEFDVSSATIRNEMAFLEETDYLYQPHTSAGRVPRPNAYRLYVNRIEPKRLSQGSEEVRMFEGACRRLGDNPRMLLRTTSRNLADMTGHPGILMTPTRAEGTFESISVTPVSANNVMLRYETGDGKQFKKLLHSPASLTADEIATLSRALKKLYTGRPISQLATLTATDLRASVGGLNIPEKLITALRRAVDVEEDREIFVEGTSYVLGEPEFQTHSALRDVIELLDQSALLREVLLPAMSAEEVTVAIGGENRVETMRNCSLVARSYRAPTGEVGTLGVLGPLSMNYAHTMPVVGFIARQLSVSLATRADQSR
ncbi:MAG: heat-inducible transcriptional repressor HrcA [Armatimonadota bacterium]